MSYNYAYNVQYGNGNPNLDMQFGYQADMSGFGQIDAEAQIINERNAEIQKIAKDAQDLQQIYQDTRDLVNSDRAKLEDISVTTGSSNTNVEQAKNDLAEADASKRKLRKKCFIIWGIIGLILIIAIIIILTIFFEFIFN